MADWDTIWREERRLNRSAALRVRFLLENGLLNPEYSASMTVRWTVGEEEDSVVLAWDAKTRNLTIRQVNAEAELMQLTVVHLLHGKQRQTFFIDPASGERCMILHAMGGKLGTRRTFNIAYPSRRLTKAQTRELKLQHPELLNFPVAADPIVEKPVHWSSRASRRANRESVFYGTAAAFRDGWNLAYGPPASLKPHHRMLAIDRSKHIDMEPRARPWPADHLEVGLWEEQPRLELFELQRAGLLVDGERHFARLSFDHARAQLHEADVCADLRDPSRPLISIIEVFVVDPEVGPFYSSHTIELTPPANTPQRRRYLICPITKKRVDTLAYREGEWGCKAALRLENVSQRSEKYVARIQRARVDAPWVRKPRSRV